jgi:hypothetical protein
MLNRPLSKDAASEGPRRYKPHFVWAVRLCIGLGERPSSASDLRESFRYVEGLNDARTLLAVCFSILLVSGFVSDR